MSFGHLFLLNGIRDNLVLLTAPRQRRLSMAGIPLASKLLGLRSTASQPPRTSTAKIHLASKLLPLLLTALWPRPMSTADTYLV